MKNPNALIPLLALLLIFLAVPARAEVATSTASDQTGVEVTVYNSDLALVKDSRKVALPEGEGELRFMDVASAIKPETVHVKSKNYPESLAVLEQNYEFDLISPEKLLEKFVGQTIKIEKQNDYQDKTEMVDAKLLSVNNGLVFEIEGQIYLNYPGLKIVPSIPENLYARPTLAWLYANSSKDPHELEVSYMTNGMNWKADYILVLGDDDKRADLTGWVTLNNRSGASYKDAVLKLIAGEVRQVREAMPNFMLTRSMSMPAPMAAPSFEEEEFFEYHIYNLSRPTTIGNNQTKQISLLEAFDTKVKKELIARGSTSYFQSSYRDSMKQKVDVEISFKNSEENNLGMPLPKGVIRLYKKDSGGSLQFIGEDRIDHTPRNEEIRLTVGAAFDVVAERRQTNYKKLAEKLIETSWELTVKNRKKDEAATVSFLETAPGDWEVVSSTGDYKKTSAFGLRFDITAAPDEEKKVEFTIRSRF